MADKTHQKTLTALELFKGGMTAYQAAKTAGIALSTIYRSAEYRAIVGIGKDKPA